MKRLMTLGVLAAVALLTAFYGRDLLGLYHLQQYIGDSAQAYEAEGPWPHLTDVCTSCHGNGGRSLHQRYPSLAGQPAPYLIGQLQQFADGQRRAPNMEPLAKTLSESDIRQLADYFARQSPPDNQSFRPDAGLLDAGKQLVTTRGCVACHGQNLQGAAGFPRLAGQGVDYLRAQLDAFADGRRREPTGAMQAMAAALSADERKAIAHYLASANQPPQHP
ncbi:c-type cytochrome [Pseudomonas sp. NPDC089534]|uniref:c-type cytochrome n=1 Tax=Pseudomonas sp. NPDC089534 TaxID=3364468 RepID=UPI0037FAA736